MSRNRFDAAKVARNTAFFTRLVSLPEGPEKTELRNQIVEENRGLVWVQANRGKNRFPSGLDAESVGYMALIQAVDRFDPTRGGVFALFATRAIKRAIRDELEREQRYASLFGQEPSEEGMDTLAFVEDGNLGGAERADLLERALEGCSPRERDILYRLAEGQTQKEIGADLGITQQAVQQVKEQAIKKCRRQLQGV